jgi:transcriptional regulator with XRE-family HTH domain
MLHIGQEIKKVMKERRMKVVEFARRISTDRNNVYDIYRRKSIDTDLLAKISETLQYDFFAICSRSLLVNKFVQNAEDPYTGYGKEGETDHQVKFLKEQLSILEERLGDKDEIIRLLKQGKA